MTYITASLVMLSTSFAVTASDGHDPFMGDIDEETVLDDSPYVFINSRGGLVDRSFELVPELKEKTCIVFNAASAALMIVLPACKERYFVEGARLGFHSAVYSGYFSQITEWSAKQAALNLAAANRRMMYHMIQHQAPFTPQELELHMRNNTLFTSDQIRAWNKWILPVEQCEHCPSWTKMVQLKSAEPLLSNSSGNGKVTEARPTTTTEGGQSDTAPRQ